MYLAPEADFLLLFFLIRARNIYIYTDIYMHTNGYMMEDYCYLWILWVFVQRHMVRVGVDDF